MKFRYLVLLMSSAFLVAAQQTPTSVEDQARRVVELLLAQDLSTLLERFSPQMKQALPEEALRGTVMPQIKSLGAVQAIGKSELVNQQNMVVAIVPVQFAKTAVRFQITFNQAVP